MLFLFSLSKFNPEMNEEQENNISQFTHKMKPRYTIITLLIVPLLTIQSESKFQDSKNRRILHQPLFQAIPPPLEPPPPPDSPEQDQPFSNEFQTGPTPDQWPQPQPSPPATYDPITPPQPSNSTPTKKVAIAVTSAILTLAMLSGLAFFLYKNNPKNPNESQKLIGQENSQSINEESRMPPPSTFLCIEPPDSSTTYKKLNSEIHHPLTKPPPPPAATNSPPPPPMSSSSDEETHSSSHCRNHHVANTNSLPHSRRTSPRSRFSASSPDPKLSHPTPPPVISLGPLQPSKTLTYTPKRTSFSPSPDRQSIMVRNNKPQISKIPNPPPPPPPPPIYGPAKTYTPLPASQQLMIRPKSKSPSPKAKGSDTLKTSPVAEINNVSTLEKLDGSRPKMQPFHWDKVGTTSEEGTVWDQLKSSSFKLNEDAIDSLFGCNSANSVPKKATKKFVLPSFTQENRILDTKKSQNIAILLRALNVTREEVSEAILDGNPEGLDPELFETLVKMAPSKEEEIKLKNCNLETSKLGVAERFLKAILDIPFAFKRVEAMLYRANFDTEVKYLRKSFQTLEEASEELKNSRLFLKLLEAVLRTGNRMNNGTNRGEAKAFKLDTLLKLVDIKGTDGKTTLLHFVVQEIIRSETDLPNKNNLKFNEDDFKKQGLAVVAGLSRELSNVKKAAGMDSDVLSSYVTKLETGLQKIRHVLQYEDEITHKGKFFDSMKQFLKEAGDEISRVKAEERKAVSLVREVTQYFHGDTAKQEGHALRIFMVIRDFLMVLDNVCKDVGRMQDRATIGSGRSFRISAATPLPVLNRCNVGNDDTSCSDDDSM